MLHEIPQKAHRCLRRDEDTRARAIHRNAGVSPAGPAASRAAALMALPTFLRGPAAGRVEPPLQELSFRLRRRLRPAGERRPSIRLRSPPRSEDLPGLSVLRG